LLSPCGHLGLLLPLSSAWTAQYSVAESEHIFCCLI
jgi:hypothetical protein